MKKLLPWIISGVLLVWVISSVRPPKDKEFQESEFGRLPVVLNGRVQPWDSVARNVLLQIRTKQSVPIEDKKTLTATQWLLEVMMHPRKADERKVFRIDHPELLGLLKLSPDEKYFSFSALKEGFEELDKQAQRASQIESAHRTAFEKAVMRLHHNLTLYHRLKNSVKPETADHFVEELTHFLGSITNGVQAVRDREAGKQYDTKALKQFGAALTRYDTLANTAYPLSLPPAELNGNKEAWRNPGTVLVEATQGKNIPKSLMVLASLCDAYNHTNKEAFNQAITEYKSLFPPGNKEVKKAGLEYLYNHLQAFYRASAIYILAVVLIFIYWLNSAEWMRSSANMLLIVGCTVHTAGMVLRMVLEGRPPVTNLYSSAVFIGWGSVLLGLFLEKFQKDGIGIIVGGVIGFITQIIAHNLSLAGDTMEMLRAVLDTNFWLATHVVTITLGYSANFVAGLLGIIYILRGVLSTSLPKQTASNIERMVYGIICFATLFSFIGTVLGGIWADQSWGRFWGWDPKENGALIIVLWNAAILHAYWDRSITGRGLMNMSIFGNIITSFSWFGVNMLGIGLHSYGFMDEAFRWLVIFITSQLLIIGLGLIPMCRWKSALN